MRINGSTYPINERPEIDWRTRNSIQIVVRSNNRFTSCQVTIGRFGGAGDRLSNGRVQLAIADDKRKEAAWDIESHSLHLACVKCGTSYDHLTPHHFSFNSQIGWCPSCNGLGKQIGRNLDAFMDPTLSLSEQGLKLWPALKMAESLAMLKAFCERHAINPNVPIGALTAGQKQLLMFGTGDEWYAVEPDETIPVGYSFQFKGLVPALENASRSSVQLRMYLDNVIAEVDCITCAGSRVRPEAAHAVFHELTIVDIVNMSLGQLLKQLINGSYQSMSKRCAGNWSRRFAKDSPS